MYDRKIFVEEYIKDVLMGIWIEECHLKTAVMRRWISLWHLV